MRRLTLHSFTVPGHVEDIEIYVADPIYKWQQTPMGKWCKEHATNLHWLTALDPGYSGYRITITGDLEDKLVTEFLLRREPRSTLV